jgi:hypothetical protein
VLDHPQERRIGLPALVELERRQAQPLLKDLRRVAGVATRDAASDVGMVRHGDDVAGER